MKSAQSLAVSLNDSNTERKHTLQLEFHCTLSYSVESG